MVPDNLLTMFSEQELEVRNFTDVFQFVFLATGLTVRISSPKHFRYIYFHFLYVVYISCYLASDMWHK